MNDYSDMAPEARFDLLQAMAAEFFGTDRWKTAFCRRYGLTPQSLTVWTNKGAPQWAAQAMADALAAKKLGDAVRVIQSVSIPDELT